MKKSILSLVATLAIAGCVKNEIAAPVYELGFEPEDVVATLNDETKTSLGSTGSVLWSQDDHITVLYKGTKYAMSYKVKAEGVGTNQATFSYDATQGFYTTTIETAFTKYYGFYPALVANTVPMEDGKLQVTIPAAQSYAKESFDATAAVMTGSSTTTDIPFKNATGLLKIFLTPVGDGPIPPIFKVNSIVLTSESHLLAGAAFIDASNAAVIKEEGGVKTVTLSCGEDGIALDQLEQFKTFNGNAFIFALPPTIFENEDLTITVNLTEGDTPRAIVKKLTKEGGFKVERSKIATVPFGYSLADITGGIETTSAADIADLNERLEAGATDITLSGANDAHDTNVIFPKAAENKDVNIAITGEIAAQTEGEYTGKSVIFFENAVVQGDTNEGPATLTVSAPAGTVLVFNTPQSHVVLNGTYYEEVSGAYSMSTLVIKKDLRVGTLTITKGGLEIHGQVDAVTAIAEGAEVVVRDCEGLSQTVYDALKAFIDENYVAVQQTDGTWNIVEKPAVAKIGDVEYKDLDAAVRTATTGDVITLCADVDNVRMMASSEQYGDIALYIDGKVVTLDLNGYNVTVPMSDSDSGVCFWGANGGKITIKDSSESKSGTFDYGGRYIAANNALMILGGSYNFKLTSSYCQVGDEPVQVGERWTVGPIFEKGTGSQTDPFSVDTKEQFLKLQSVDLRNYNLNGRNTRVYFKVNTDLEFTESVGESSYSDCIITQLINSEIDFANGNGENHTVTLPEEVCFLGNVFGGCLKNVNVNLNEESIVSLIAGPFEFNNVCASGEVTPGNNTGAYVTYVQGTHVSFTDCISNVEMYGSGGENNYNSVFVGYVYSGTVNLDFTNCVNKGSLVCGKASMFIGNPNAPTIVLNVTNCVNEGTIKATYMADDYKFNYYFSTSSNNYKFVLNGVEYNHNNSLPTSYMPNVLEDNCVINRGTVENGPENTGLVLSRNEDKTFTITPATDNKVGDKTVDHYTVGLGLYTGISNGSCLFFATETIDSDGSASYTTTLKDYKFVDISFVNGDEMGELAGNRTFTKDGETYYVVLDDETVRGEHGAAPAQMYYLSAFDADNKLLASVSLSESQRSARPTSFKVSRYSRCGKERVAPASKVSIFE